MKGVEENVYSHIGGYINRDSAQHTLTHTLRYTIPREPVVQIAGEDEMRCPSSSSEAGKKKSEFFFFFFTFCSIQALNGMANAHPH